MSTYRSKFFINDSPVEIPGVRWVTDAQKLHGAQNINIAQVTLPGRDGELVIPSTRTVGASEWELSVAVTGDDYFDFLTNKAQLEALMSPMQDVVTITELITDSNGNTVKQLDAVAMLSGTSMDSPWDSSDDGAEMTYTFRIPSGSWVEPEVSFNITGTNSVAVPFAVAAGGSAPQYEIRIEFVPSANDATFSLVPSSAVDASLSFYGDGTVTTGQTITIESKTLNATQSGNNVSKYLDSGSAQFHINPDGAVWVPTFHGISSMTVYTRKAWY